MANKFWVGGTDTWDGTAGSKWSTTSGGGGGTAIPGASDVAIFDGGSGSAVVTVAASIGGTNTLGGISMTGTGNFTGTLDFATNNPSLTITGSFSISGSGTRTVNLGSSTFTLTGTNTNNWDCTTSTGLTLNAGSETFSIGSPSNNNGQTFVGGGKSYGTLAVGSRTNNSGVSITGTNTFAAVTVTAPTRLSFAQGTTTTITAAVNWAGTSSNPISFLGGGATSPTVALAGGSTITWASIYGITFTGSPTATNSLNNQGNGGITITAPSAGSVGVIGS